MSRCAGTPASDPLGDPATADPACAPVNASRGWRSVTAAQLYLWSAGRGEWLACPPDEITWLDRHTLSENTDLTLHRAPRCAGLRYVHHGWELFSRDTTHRVYIAPAADLMAVTAAAVERSARHVLPAAPEHYEAIPFNLGEGTWLVSVGSWVVRLRLEQTRRPHRDDGTTADRQLPPTQDGRISARVLHARENSPPREGAVDRVRAFFERNGTARLAMAYYYAEYIIGVAAPQTVPMADVAIALDLSNEGAVSDYKKQLQGLIWAERGHARQLPGFLLSNGLLTLAHLDEARRVAAANERSGICATARERLRYRPNPGVSPSAIPGRASRSSPGLPGVAGRASRSSPRPEGPASRART
jgi:hypothetical protein